MKTKLKVFLSRLPIAAEILTIHETSTFLNMKINTRVVKNILKKFNLLAFGHVTFHPQAKNI